MLSCEHCEIFKSTYFEEHLQTTASANHLINPSHATGVFLHPLKISEISGMKWLNSLHKKRGINTVSYVWLNSAVIHIVWNILLVFKFQHRFQLPWLIAIHDIKYFHTTCICFLGPRSSAPYVDLWTSASRPSDLIRFLSAAFHFLLVCVIKCSCEALGKHNCEFSIHKY